MYTQDYIDNLPHLGSGYVLKLGKKKRKEMGLKHYIGPYACKECGCYVRVCSDLLANHVHCANCTKCFKGMGLTLPFKESKLQPPKQHCSLDEGKEFSVMTMKLSEKKHNERVEALSKANWRLPVAFNSNIK